MSHGFDRDHEEPAEEGSPAWMTSFCDMTVLMLCFFVLLLSFAKTDNSTFHSALSSVRQALGAAQTPPASVTVDRGPSSAPASTPARAPAHEAPRAKESSEEQTEAITLARFRAYLAERGLAADVEVSASPRGIVLRTRDRVLFEPADATLKPDGLPVLDAVRGLCQELEGKLAVEGHSDDRPITNAIFPSNWELSGARAAQVLRYLVAAGVDPARVHVAGYADTHPVASNGSDAGRAQNRRVEFVFESDAARSE